jgi:hypothetical protein
MTSEYFQESGFSCAIGPDYAIAIALREGDIYFIEQNSFSKLNRQIRNR